MKLNYFLKHLQHMKPIKFLIRIAIILAISPTVLANNRAEPVEISADIVEMKEKTFTSIYKGNAKLKQGNDFIHADTITIYHPDMEIQSVSIKGNYKKPAHIKLTINKKIIEGWAVKVDYNLDTKVLTLHHNVRLKQEKNYIKAEYIKFDQKQRKLKATSTRKGRVVTVFTIPK